MKESTFEEERPSAAVPGDGSTHEKVRLLDELRPARPTPDDLDAMGDEIAQLAGQIAAAEARFIRLLGSFDVWEGWGGPGVRSLAHWLSWRAGMSLRTAREHVRMARALRDLPRTEDAFGAGELSFSKVRALTRIATRETEASLLAIARNAPAAHVERLVAGLRKAKKDSDDRQKDSDDRDDSEERDGKDDEPESGGGPPESAPAQRLQWRWDEETGELVVWGRFGAADGRLLLAALTRAELERIRTTEHEEQEPDERDDSRSGTEDRSSGPDDGRAGTDDGSPGSDENCSGTDESRSGPDAGHAGPDDAPAEPGTRSEAVDRTAPPPSDAGPALVALAQIGLTAQEAPAHAPAAEVIYLHQDDRHLHDADRTQQAQDPGGVTSRTSEGEKVGSVSADDGPALDPGTAEEVLCGSASRCVLRGAGGAVLAYGRRRRLFSSAQLKALRLRDRCCQTPGCGRTRFLHAHHVVYWWHGGRTDLDNAVLLCSACHRSVHLGRLVIRALGGQRFEFIDGVRQVVIDPAPPMSGRADEIVADRRIGPRTVTGGWSGEPLDLSLATSGLLDYWREQRASDPPAGRGGGWGSTVYDHAVAWDDPSLGPWVPVSAA